MKRTPLKRRTPLRARRKPVSQLRNLSKLCELRLAGCNGRAQHAHHRKLRAQGGTDTLLNLIAVCFRCHDYIHHNVGESYANGWLVRSWDDPARVPVTTWREAA